MSKIRPEKFLAKFVTIRIDYQLKNLEVYPEMAKVWSDDPSPKSSRPLEIRWIVENLEKKDAVRIRPKNGSSNRLFNPDHQGVFEIPWPQNSIVSGRPNAQERRRLTGSEKKVDWFYAVEVVRGGKVLFGIDPCIVVEADG